MQLTGTPTASRLPVTSDWGARGIRAIRDKWLQARGSGGHLGFPLTSEQHQARGRIQSLQHGSIFWTPQKKYAGTPLAKYFITNEV